MKQKGREYANWTSELKTDENIEKTLPVNGENKKWYDYIPLARIKDLLPVLRYVHGLKSKVQFDGFAITSENNKTIFERNKHFFHSVGQVDRVAWYIGSKMLDLIYLKHNGLKKTKLTEWLESQEDIYRTLDQMKIVKETLNGLIEKWQEGYVTDEELDQHAEAFLKVFTVKDDRIKMGKMLDQMMSEKEILRTKNRLRQREYRNFEAKAKGIEGVKN